MSQSTHFLDKTFQSNNCTGTNKLALTIKSAKSHETKKEEYARENVVALSADRQLRVISKAGSLEQFIAIEYRRVSYRILDYLTDRK